MRESQHRSEILSRNFSESLKKARGSRSQAEFARFLGISSQATYQRYEAGRIPDGDILYQIASRLGIPMEHLLNGCKDVIQPEKGFPDPELYFILGKPRPQHYLMSIALHKLTDSQILEIIDELNGIDDPEMTPKAKQALTQTLVREHLKKTMDAKSSELNVDNIVGPLPPSFAGTDASPKKNPVTKDSPPAKSDPAAKK